MLVSVVDESSVAEHAVLVDDECSAAKHAILRRIGRLEQSMLVSVVGDCSATRHAC